MTDLVTASMLFLPYRPQSGSRDSFDTARMSMYAIFSTAKVCGSRITPHINKLADHALRPHCVAFSVDLNNVLLKAPFQILLHVCSHNRPITDLVTAHVFLLSCSPQSNKHDSFCTRYLALCEHGLLSTAHIRMWDTKTNKSEGLTERSTGFQPGSGLLVDCSLKLEQLKVAHILVNEHTMLDIFGCFAIHWCI